MFATTETQSIPRPEGKYMSDDDKKLPTIQNRIITTAVDIWQDDPLER